ncbi:MAG: hypothetical protein LBH73_05080 [Spirochaetaceae bacterium]|jgi:hypothetical protein|nr:hypothetical protein [Spirochaetaceae bacterium]
MIPKIALLTYPFLSKYMKKLVRPLEERCVIDIIEFPTQYASIALIRKNLPKYDGFCVYSALLKKFIDDLPSPLTRPVFYLDGFTVDFFKTFFLILAENRQLDFAKVYTDTTLLFQDEARSLADIHKNFNNFEKDRLRYLERLNLETFMTMEGRIEAAAKEFWRRKRFSLLVCRNGYVAQAMQDAKIPYAFVYPDETRVTEILEKLLDTVQLNRMADSFPASIMVFSAQREISAYGEVSPESVRVQKALLEFGKEFAVNFTIHPRARGYELLCSRRIVRKITNGYRNCQLKHYLFSALGMDIRIGYGVGQDIMSARRNALEACGAAESLGNSAVVTEAGNLITMNSSAEERGRADRPVEAVNIAARSGLSVQTIGRIQSALHFRGSDELTTQDLAGSLQVTVANANRFLNSLVKNGLAEVIAEKKTVAKGRPSRIYKISRDLFSGAGAGQI